MAERWDPKDPDNIEDFAVDWADRLVPGDQINGSTFTIVSGTVVIDDSDFDDTTATVWLSGGTADETCSILNRVTTVGGRQYDCTKTLKIKER